MKTVDLPIWILYTTGLHPADITQKKDVGIIIQNFQIR